MSLILALSAWIFGILLSGYLVPNILVFILPPIFLAGLFLVNFMLNGKEAFYTKSGIFLRKCTVYLLILSLGATRYLTWEARGYLEAISFKKSQSDTLCGVIVSEVSRYDSTNYFYLREENGRKLRVTVRSEEPLAIGQKVSLSEPTLTAVNISNKKIPDTKKLLGNEATLKATFPYHAKVEIHGIANPLLYYIKQARSYMADLFQTQFPNEIAGLLSSILSSDRSNLPEEMYQDFLDTGTVHILVVSGMHFGYLSSALLMFLHLFCHSRRKNLILLTVILLIFALFAGGSLPVIRAFLMILMLFFADLFYLRRCNSRMLVLGLASLFLASSPGLIFQPSFLLSFGATFGIVLFYHPLQKLFWRIKSDYLRSYLSMHLSAQIFTLPVVCYFFRRISTVSFLTNFLVGPLVPVILVLSILCPLSRLVPVVSSLVTVLTRWSCGLFLWLVKFTAKIAPPLSLTLSETAFLGWLLFGVSLTVLPALKKHRQKMMAAFLTAILFLTSVTITLFPPKPRDLFITFFGASNTNSAVIHTKENQVILYGNLTDILHAQYSASFAKEPVIELLILTHLPDQDGLSQFIKSHSVKEIVLPKMPPENWKLPCKTMVCTSSLTGKTKDLQIKLISDGDTFSEVEFTGGDLIFSFTQNPEYLLDHWYHNPDKYWIYNFKRTGKYARAIPLIPDAQQLFSKKKWHPGGKQYSNYSILEADTGRLFLSDIAEQES